MEADNSCLFVSMGYVMYRDRERGRGLRSVIAREVGEHPELWTEAMLEKPPHEYQRWIADSQRWGGQIELCILAKHFRKEVAAYDIQTQRCDVYGQVRGDRLSSTPAPMTTLSPGVHLL